jgi:transposase
LKIDTRKLDQKTIASIVGISAEGGVEMTMNFAKSVNIPKFKQYIQEIRELYPDEKIAVFMDRLNVHRSNKVRDYMSDLGMVRILNASYSPNFNPAEGIIGFYKRQIKNLRLNAIANDEGINLYEVIEEITGNIRRNTCLNFVNKSN